MTNEQMSHFRDRLLRVTNRARQDAAAVREQSCGTAGSQSGALSNVPTHLGDLATETYLQELNSTLLENEEYLVAEAIAGLRRIDEGTFGVCENCGANIPTERLNAIPWARYCATCAESLNAGPAVNFNAGRVAKPSETLAGASHSPPDIEVAAGGEVEEGSDSDPQAGPGGGAVGGTPAGKRARARQPHHRRKQRRDTD